MSRDKSPKHCEYIRTLPCLICGNPNQTECAHIRFADPSVAKPITGMGIKPDDCWTVPLCSSHHREQHSFGERKWWRAIGKDPIRVAMALHRVSGDYGLGLQIVLHAATD